MSTRDKNLSDERKQTIRDEQDAEVREGERQASIEKAAALEAVEKATQEAAVEETADAAKKTFGQKLRYYLGF